MEISPERKHLLTQVLEFWYTTDFMTQGALKTEKTREEKEIYSYVMKNPTKFSILCQHDFLNTGENILTKINSLETLLESKKKQENEKAGKKSLETQNPSDRCCHGRITVYVGSINRAYLSNRIAYQLGCELPNNPSADRIALASFQLSDEGTLIVDSLSLSPILWAIRRISEKSSDDTMYKVLDPEIYKEDQTKFFSHEEPPSCDYDKLQIFAHRIIENTVVSIKADVDEADVSSEIHYRYSIYCNSSEKTKRETDEYSSLSMSFYSDDLKRFKETIECDKWLENNDMWNALIDYICAPYDMLHGNHNPLQKDLSILALQNSSTSSATRKAIKDILRVVRSPWGKWPLKYRPFLMQQVAINIAINTNKPFFSVHGPPGTGKTTLLCELVAENVVQRAVMLSRFERPDDLFKSEQLQISGRSVTYYSFLDKYKDIRKYGLVVASSNNAAVENITRQLPLIENLDKKLRGSDSPQIESIRNLFSLDHAKSEVVERPNYEKEDRPQEPVKLQDIYFSSYASELMRAPCWGLLGAALGKKGNVVRFYKKVLKQIYWDFYHKNEDFCTNRITQYTEARRFFKKQYDIVKELRAELQKQVDHAESENQIMHGHGEDEFICITDAFFDDLSSKNDIQKREKAQMTNPRLSLHYDREREKLFHASLILTKEFILSSDACRKNFHLLGCVWGLESFDNPFKTANSQHKSETFQKCTTYLIQTLQLLVPVISTTFASAGRFFKDVKKADALGTILVDEAGQVRPQMALRLFSKASKAIVVGDPNQIDPIVTDELGFLESKLACDIGEAYSDRTLSVQKIADYLSPFGGTQCDSYKFESQKRTGVPLYVHSRCIEPMFSISNRLSYGNAMLCITSQPSQSLKDSFCYQTSQWINVSGKEDRKKNHFIRPQGHRVLQLLETAFKKNARKTDKDSKESGPDIFVISPFHTVAEGMRQMLSKALLGTDYPVLAENKELVQDWLTDENNPHIGTVHTFQGREANEVIFLLGCDEDSKKSANWVKKNIINVAVSRARYRLYVIGDIKVWNQCEPVMEMKCDLDSYVWETLAWLANAQGSSASIDDLKIPALPSAEMYEIERVEDSSEEDYIINTTSGNENIRAFLPSVQTEAFPKALHLLESTSMEDFYKSFHPDIQRLLNTGVSLYDVLCRQADMEHLASYDMSCIGINFCKAFELTLKQNYFPGLQKLLPNVLIGGRKISEINTQQYQMTIGDFTTIISQNQELLAKQMSHHGYKEMHSEWWKTLLQKMQDFKKYRNACCHSGQEKAFTLKELENCLNLLFKEFKVPKKGLLGKEGSIRGLMLDTCFRDAINSIRKNTDFTGNSIIAADQIQTDTTGVPLLDFTDQYVEITVRTKFCVVDGSILTQEAIPVRRTNGQSKKLNMQYCSKCGRCYLNVAKLSESTHLKDYKLTAIKPEEWK